MIGYISIVLVVIADLFFAIPVIAIFNRAYTGDQALMGVPALLFLIPAFVMAGFEIYKKGIKKAKGAWIALSLFFVPLAIVFAVAGGCDATGWCGQPNQEAAKKLESYK